MSSMFMNDDYYKTWLKYNQYNIPKKYYCIASEYGNKLTYNQITILYAIAVDEVLTIYNVSLINELPFGLGFVLAKDKWVEKMKEALEVYNHKEVSKDEDND